MENENLAGEQTEVVEQKYSPLRTVTPLSKYLAMALFVILPFLGGWIGYTYAPEKIVEVEKVVEVEKKAPQVPFSRIDKKFYTNDTSYDSSWGNIDYVLEGNTLFWNSNHQENSWASTTVSNPDSLEYVAYGILTDGEKVYSATPDSVIDSLIPQDGIEVLKSDSIDLLVNGQKVYGFHTEMNEYATLSKEPIITKNPESIGIVGGKYFKDSDRVYFLAVFDDIIEVEGADAASFQGLSLGLGADKNSVFHVEKKLEGVDPKVDPDTITFSDTNPDYPQFITDGDRAWVPHSSCDTPSYKEIPISGLESYSHC